MLRILITCFILSISLPAIADIADERKATRTKLLANLKAASTEKEGRTAEDAIRHFWLKGPTMDLTVKLLIAIQARKHYSFDKALELLDYVISKAPDYSEAYNQRAFVFFLQRKYGKALDNIIITLQLEPKHFGALTGRAIIMLYQGRNRLARKALTQAIEIHPWLRERSFLSRMPAG